MANERRVYEHFRTGVITDDPLEFDAVTFSSDELIALSEIDNTEHVAIILDPFGLADGPEVVYVTGHIGGSTDADIIRAREGTTAVEHPVGTRWAASPTENDWLLKVATEADLPSGNGLPFLGQECFIVTGKRHVWWNGTAWRDISSDAGWTTFVPSIGGGWTKGSGTVVGRYRRRDRDISIGVRFVVGNGAKSSTAGGLVIGNFPVPCAAGLDFLGGVNFFDASAGISYPGVSNINPGASAAKCQGFGVPIGFAVPLADVSTNFPATPFSVGDVIAMNINYEGSS